MYISSKLWCQGLFDLRQKKQTVMGKHFTNKDHLELSCDFCNEPSNSWPPRKKKISPRRRTQKALLGAEVGNRPKRSWAQQFQPKNPKTNPEMACSNSDKLIFERKQRQTTRGSLFQQGGTVQRFYAVTL